MTGVGVGPRVIAMVLAIVAVAAFPGCGQKDKADAPAGPPATAPAAQGTTATNASWTPEALEELLAPIALFPDPILSQIFMVSANPQEVLDAGNWLIQNPDLEGKSLDTAAEQAGFSPPMRALIQFPQVVDMMCSRMGWTEELGQACANDEPGVLDSVQRLRRQAIDAGNLKSSDQMKVETQIQDGKDVVLLSPPSKDVVYVPQYDPVAAYAPPPAMAQPTTVVQQNTGYSTTALVTTGLLAFGAGMLVNEVFFNDDDDDHDEYHYKNNYYPNYGYGSMPPYPPYPYHPNYGNGYRPGHTYNRPPSYKRNNNVVVVNQNNNYWNRYDASAKNNSRPGKAQSPITSAKPNRPELADLNKRPRPATPAKKEAWKGKDTYAGARPATQDAKARLPQGSRDVAKMPASASAATNARTPKRPEGPADRGYTGARQAPKKETREAGGAAGRRDSAVSGSQHGKADKAASQRGRESLKKTADKKQKSGGETKKKKS